MMLKLGPGVKPTRLATQPRMNASCSSGVSKICVSSARRLRGAVRNRGVGLRNPRVARENAGAGGWFWGACGPDEHARAADPPHAELHNAARCAHKCRVWMDLILGRTKRHTDAWMSMRAAVWGTDSGLTDPPGHPGANSSGRSVAGRAPPASPCGCFPGSDMLPVAVGLRMCLRGVGSA